MSVSADDEIVITEGAAARDARLYRWFLDHLAKFPGRVTIVTFIAAAAVTAIVVTADGDASPTTVISLGATLWALFFAVMIYLLTARDTDKVLEQIADLHEQLATALVAPDEEEATATSDEGAEAGPAEEAEEATATSDEGADEGEAGAADTKHAGVTPGLPDSPADGTRPEVGRRNVARPDQTRPDGDRRSRRPVPVGGGRDLPGGAVGVRPVPHLLVGVPAIVDGVPSDLLEAWVSATGKSRDQLSRAWSRDPRTDRQWVLESDGDQRWVVFSKGTRGVGVMSLDIAGHGHGRRPSAH